MTRCEYCDVRLAEGSRFCDRCGGPVASGDFVDVPEPPGFLAPEGWVQYRDVWLGIRLYHPPGWRAIQGKGSVAVAEHAASPVAVMVQIARESSARAMATRIVQERSALDPTLRVAPTSAADDRRTVLRATGTVRGYPVEGILDFEARGQSCVMKAWLAPPSAVGSVEPVLRTVLASLAPVPSVRRTPWVEPMEGSFRVTLASGWSANGGMRRDTGLPQGWFEAWGDPQGQRRLRLFAERHSFSEGFMGAMMGQPSLPYRPAPQLAREWLLPRWAREHPDLRLLRLEDRPELAAVQLQELQKECAARLMPQMSAEVTVADGLVWYTEGGVGLLERFGFQTVRMSAGPFGAPLPWIAEVPALMRGPADGFDRVEPVLAGMVLSLYMNPAWEQANRDRDNARSMAVQQDIWARQRQISQTLSETSDIVANSYWSSQQIHQEHALGRQASAQQTDWAHEWSNAMLGWEDRVDDTGQTYSIPAGHERAWRDNQGNLIVGGPLANPDPTWHELKPTRG